MNKILKVILPLVLIFTIFFTSISIEDVNSQKTSSNTKTELKINIGGLETQARGLKLPIKTTKPKSKPKIEIPLNIL